MGMDISGRHPSRSSGRSFRANISDWPAIRRLCVELCSDLLDADTLDAMSFNDGAGPTDQATCTQMADRFAVWLEQHAAEITLDDGLDVDQLEEWVKFLRYCGGFAVW